MRLGPESHQLLWPKILIRLGLAAMCPGCHSAGCPVSACPLGLRHKATFHFLPASGPSHMLFLLWGPVGALPAFPRLAHHRLLIQIVTSLWWHHPCSTAASFAEGSSRRGGTASPRLSPGLQGQQLKGMPWET